MTTKNNRINDNKNNRVIPNPRQRNARSRAPIRARFWREWAERVSRGEGPCALLASTKHKVPRVGSRAEENARFAPTARDDDVSGFIQSQSSLRTWFIGSKSEPPSGEIDERDPEDHKSESQ
jgi:hypothetical protein